MNYSYIENQHELIEIVSRFKQQPFLYIDLEFDKNHFRYGFNLCLVQLSDGNDTYLIDPLAQLDVSVIFPLLSDPTIQKVSYAFGEDLRLLHHLGCFPKNILDLATARTLLNLEHISLNKIIEQITGEALQKSEQKSNWCERPLTPEQLHYAAMDVHYLPEIKDDVLAAIAKMSRSEWLTQEISLLDEQNWAEENDYVSIHEKEKKYYTQREWLRYIALINFREQQAAQLNRPSYKIIDKALLEQLAKQPSGIHNWLDQKRVHPALKNKKTIELLRKLFRSVEQTITEENIPENLPARIELSREEKMRLRDTRNRQEELKQQVFLPIKEAIKADYGEHFANYLLSNRKVERLLKKELRLLAYQEEMVSFYGKKLNIAVDSLNLY